MLLPDLTLIERKMEKEEERKGEERKGKKRNEEKTPTSKLLIDNNR